MIKLTILWVKAFNALYEYKFILITYLVISLFTYAGRSAMSDTIENKIILRGKTWSNFTWNRKYRIKLFNSFASMKLSRDVMSFVRCFKRDILCVFSLKNEYRSKKSLMLEYIFIFKNKFFFISVFFVSILALRNISSKQFNIKFWENWIQKFCKDYLTYIYILW